MTLQSLPLVHRLALSYAPASSREDVLNLLLLDTRLASIVRNMGEVMIAQIKLAWWRERLGEDPSRWPKGEPLLERLQAGSVDPVRFAPLVDGWEVMLLEAPSASDLGELVRARASAWSSLGSSLAPEDAATEAVMAAAGQWTLAELLIVSPELEGEVHKAAKSLGLDAASQGLPRALRPLAVLRALAVRAVARGSGEMLDGLASALLALRVGLFGR